MSIEVVGRIVEVIYPRGKAKHTSNPKYIVLDERGGTEKRYVCESEYNCDVKCHDIIVCECILKGEEFFISKPPFVRVGVSNEAIKQFFRENIRGCGVSRANALYNALEDMADDGSVSNYLSELAELCLRGSDDTLLSSFGKVVGRVSPTQLLMSWYHKFDKRRLKLLGLTYTQIRECEKVCGSYFKVYQRIIDNVMTMYPIPLDKSIEILERLKRQPATEDVECGKIVRRMYENMTNRGWTCTPIYVALREFPALKEHSDRLLKDYDVIKEHECAYLKYAHKVENYVSNYLINLINQDNIKDTSTPFVDVSEYNPYSIKPSRLEAEFRPSATLSEDQKVAIQGALDHKVSIITGFPGTGKTSSIREIVHNLEQRNIEYAICAFTGKAVARLRSVLSSTVPMTFHLKIKKEKSSKFRHLIIDEASMVTTELFYDFIQRFPFPFSITFVGDPDQLPPIGWGSLFSECIKSSTIPKYNLTTNHRVYDVEGEEDGIILNTKAMVQHTLKSNMKFTPTRNFVISPGNINTISAFAQAFKKQNILSKDITVISPYNKDVEVINKAFQKLYNDDKEGVVDKRGTRWILDDRVMMTKNDYDINVMNGEEGVISSVRDDSIKVDFGPGREFDFPLEPKSRRYGKRSFKGGYNDDDEERTVKKLIHSYCVTVHRSQGSEWDYVIMYLPPGRSQPSYITKNLVYTGLTRAKRALFFIGNVDELEASTTRSLPYRCENFTKRLSDSLDEWESDNGHIREGEGEERICDIDYLDDYDPEFDGY